eukprot:scaffold1972_cov82-Skeletonema_dohrnii-CCMP3373.AAC.2
MKHGMLSKYPKRFTTNVPVVKDGMLATSGPFKEPKFEERHGEYTCYHIAHLECWKQCRHDNTIE